MKTPAFVVVAVMVVAHVVEPRVFRPGDQLELRGNRLALHLAPGTTKGAGPLLLYVTGDGGFPGGEKLFERMAPWGYPMAAIDAINYVASINTPDRELTPAAVAADFQAIIRTAQRGLGLPADRQAVLVGFSRGAGLSVAAATQTALHPAIRGVLLLALPAEEEFVRETGRTLRTYESLPLLKALKVAVIQSTGDQLVSAADAQRHFGPDGPTRRFRAVTARDHSFGGSLAELVQEIRGTVEWIVSDQK